MLNVMAWLQRHPRHQPAWRCLALPRRNCPLLATGVVGRYLRYPTSAEDNLSWEPSTTRSKGLFQNERNHGASP